MLLKERKVIHLKNSIRLHTRKETSQHFKKKAEICWHLWKNKIDFYTEIVVKIKNNEIELLPRKEKGPRADIFIPSRKQVIEIETHLTEKKKLKKLKQYQGLDLILIDAKQELKQVLRKIGK